MSSRTVFAAFLLASLLMTPSQAQTQMTVAEFLTRAEQSRGPLAMFTPAGRALMQELGGHARAVRQSQANPATNDPRLCLPERARLDLQRLIADFERLPVAQRRMTLREGFRRSMVATYPCP